MPVEVLACWVRRSGPTAARFYEALSVTGSFNTDACNQLSDLEARMPSMGSTTPSARPVAQQTCHGTSCIPW